MLETVSPGHYRLYGKLTMQDGAAVIDQLLTLINNKKLALNQLDLDVSTLESADTVLLAAIINVARTIEARNGILRIIGLSDGISGLARVYGVESLIEQYRVLS